MSLDLLAAADEVNVDADSWILGCTAVGGLVGTLCWKTHPILGLLDGFAVGGNVSRVAFRHITLRRAVENLGAHAVATAGALSLPKHPAVGYIAGVAASNMFIRREDSFIKRFDETALGEGDDEASETKALVPAKTVEFTAKKAVSAVSPEAASVMENVKKNKSPWALVGVGLLATAAGVGIISAVSRKEKP